MISWSLIFFFQMEKPAGGKRLAESLSNWSRANLPKLFSCNYFKKNYLKSKTLPIDLALKLECVWGKGSGCPPALGSGPGPEPLTCGPLVVLSP